MGEERKFFRIGMVNRRLFPSQIRHLRLEGSKILKESETFLSYMLPKLFWYIKYLSHR